MRANNTGFSKEIRKINSECSGSSTHSLLCYYVNNQRSDGVLGDHFEIIFFYFSIIIISEVVSRCTWNSTINMYLFQTTQCVRMPLAVDLGLDL